MFAVLVRAAAYVLWKECEGVGPFTTPEAAQEWIDKRGGLYTECRLVVMLDGMFPEVKEKKDGSP